MIRHHASVITTLILLFVLSSVHGASAGPPTDQLRDEIGGLVKTLKDPALSGDQKVNERRAAISKSADEIFDFTETSRRALGQHWAQRTPAEREDFVRLFTGLLQRTYLSKVDQSSLEMTFQGDTVDGDEAIVRTTLLLGKGREMSLNYRMHRTGDRWQVYDLNVEGISLVANYRKQFDRVIRGESYEALVARLTSHQTDLATTSAVSIERVSR